MGDDVHKTTPHDKINMRKMRLTRLCKEFVFGDARPFASCHASTLVQMGNGTVLAAWFGGTRESACDVGIWGAIRSPWGIWGSPMLWARVRDAAHWNPVLFHAPNGEVHLYFKVGATTREWETWTQVSRDAGATWDKARELVPGDRGGRGPVKNKPIILSDGSWLAPASVETHSDWDAFVDRSDDGGRTWTASKLVERDRSVITGMGIIQPSLWESKAGSVHMLLRNTCGAICVSDSSDGGRTWTPARRTALPNNNSGLDLARGPDGMLLLAYNPVSDPKLRTPLSLTASTDNGATWERVTDLETEPGEYSYPAVIATSMGFAGTYTWKRERIVFWSAPYP